MWLTRDLQGFRPQALPLPRPGRTRHRDRPHHHRRHGRDQTRRRHSRRPHRVLRGRHRQRVRCQFTRRRRRVRNQVFARAGESLERENSPNGRTYDRADARRFCSSSSSSSSSLMSSSALRPSMSSSDSQSTSLPFFGLAACFFCSLPLPLPATAARPSCLTRLLARGLAAAAAGPARSALASATSLRFPLRSGAPG